MCYHKQSRVRRCVILPIKAVCYLQKEKHVTATTRHYWHRACLMGARAHACCNWKWLSYFNPTQINVHSQTQVFFLPCQNRFTAKQYEANQGTIGMTLPFLMKALWKGNLIHQQQLRLGAPCHYQLSTPSLMFSSTDAEPAWRTALSDKSTPSAVGTLRTLITSVHSHTDKYNTPDSAHDELTKLDRNWDGLTSRSPLIKCILDSTGDVGRLLRFLCLITRYFSQEWNEMQQAPSALIINTLLYLRVTLCQILAKFMRGHLPLRPWSECSAHRPLYTAGTFLTTLLSGFHLMDSQMQKIQFQPNACLLVVTMCWSMFTAAWML